jgi:hypothetical protein
MYVEWKVVSMDDLAKIFGVPLSQLINIEKFLLFHILDGRVLVSEQDYIVMKEKITANCFVGFMLNRPTKAQK